MWCTYTYVSKHSCTSKIKKKKISKINLRLECSYTLARETKDWKTPMGTDTEGFLRKLLDNNQIMLHVAHSEC